MYGSSSSNEINDYGAVGGASPSATTASSMLDSFVNTDLGDIHEDESLRESMTAAAIDEEAASEDSSYYCDEDLDERLSALSNVGSFHLGGSTKMSMRNIMIQERQTKSFVKHGEDYALVPTQLKNNVRMIEDVNLIDGAGKGRLYLARYSHFNNSHDLKFAMTVQPDIYARMMSEVSDAISLPCGMFFCCHGGDGAHTGLSHNDFVDIKLAWFFFVIVIGSILAVDFWL